MADSGARRRWIGVLVLVLAAWALVRGGQTPKSADASRTTPPSASPAATAHAAPSAPASGESSPHASTTGAYDPAAYAPQAHDFTNRRWEELPDDRDLAIEAAAWHLHDLAAQLPTRRPGMYTKSELLALGYNTGSGNMLAFARGAHPGSQAQSYLDRLHANWAKAGKAMSAQP
ncbi:lytic transglycosylase domain-containing protein [Streptomyces sp. NPDC057908]|uniref:lytic transglycosylase domain-containing protein n=1 Tax=Streptomyces sp. NPDC057908 TaxID=3346276 RepID=UPI0036F04B48